MTLMDLFEIALVGATVVGVLFLLTKWIGLGMCYECGRHTAPWNAYCWTHSPFNPDNEDGGPSA